MRVLALLAAALLLLGGCRATTSFAPSGGERLPAYEGPVQVLGQLPPDGSYRLLGVVTVRGVGYTSDAEMFEQLQSEASTHGADAVVPQGKVRKRRTGDGGTELTLAGFAIRRR